MRTRRLIAAATLAAAVVTLTACDKDGTSASPTASASSTATPGAAGAGSAAPTASSATGGQGGAVHAEPSWKCDEPKLPAGHKRVEVTAAPSGGVLRARLARFHCDPNGGGFAGAGATTGYRLARGVTVRLDTGATTYRQVTTAQWSRHVTACLQGAGVTPPLTCSTGDIYEITVDGSGEVTAVSEVWHP